ncbi:hypothetical protein [Enterobacter hormaechei]|uniref:hypothetical protein n=1 Tax=Enterobacter hormaechei TaxID=158836 RepID=UPI003075EE24
MSFTAKVIRDESVNKKEKRQKEVAGYARFLSGAVLRRLWGRRRQSLLQAPAPIVEEMPGM